MATVGFVKVSYAETVTESEAQERKEYWFSQNLVHIRQFMYSLPCRFTTLMISHIYTSTVCKGCHESEVSWSHMLLHRRWEIQVMTYDLPCTTAAVTSSFHRQNWRAHLIQS